MQSIFSIQCNKPTLLVPDTLLYSSFLLIPSRESLLQRTHRNLKIKIHIYSCCSHRLPLHLPMHDWTISLDARIWYLIWKFVLHYTCRLYNNINSPRYNNDNFINNFKQLSMFRAIISPILRSTRMCLQLVI